MIWCEKCSVVLLEVEKFTWRSRRLDIFLEKEENHLWVSWRRRICAILGHLAGKGGVPYLDILLEEEEYHTWISCWRRRTISGHLAGGGGGRTFSIKGWITSNYYCVKKFSIASINETLE